MDIVGVSMILMGKINIHVSFKVWIADDADSYRAFSDRFVAPRGICYPPPFLRETKPRHARKSAPHGGLLPIAMPASPVTAMGLSITIHQASQNPGTIPEQDNSSSTQLTEILNSAFNVINGCRYTVNEWSLGLPKRAISPSVSQTSARQTSQMIAGQQSKTRKVKRSRV
jgi:hypothetical protein